MDEYLMLSFRLEKLTLGDSGHGLGETSGFRRVLGVELEGMEAESEFEGRVVAMGTRWVGPDGVGGL